MERTEAELLVRNLIDRLQPNKNGFEFPGDMLSAGEVAAMRLLAGVAEVDAPVETGAPVHPAIDLNLDCLATLSADNAVLCIDFGTAFSKAALWRKGARVPTPLPLAQGANPSATGLLLESAAYITEGRIFFGPEAVDRYRTEDSPDRALFASPKELLTHEVSRLDVVRPDKAVDPTGLFTSRALLTLYLGYLTAVVCEVLPSDVARNVKRRYAAPGWDDAQADMQAAHMGVAARSLGDLLVDGQILADTIDISEWRKGLPVERAAALAVAIRSHRDGRGIQPYRFIERAVLEAVAAGTGIQDRYMNQRPQVLVVDIGAGTTDIGVFKYVVPKGGTDSIVAPYASGMRAVKSAGNQIDEALIGVAADKLRVAPESDAAKRFRRRVRDQIRSIKVRLCEDKSVEIDVADQPRFTIDLHELIDTPIVKDLVTRFEEGVRLAIEATGNSFRSTRDESVAVFSGGGGALPFMRAVIDGKAVQTKVGPVFFRVDNSVPAWVDTVSSDVAQVYPQIAVATGGCSPHLPTELQVIGDTSDPGRRTMAPLYR